MVPVTTTPSEPFSSRNSQSERNTSRSTEPSSRNGVTTAVRISPSTARIVLVPVSGKDPAVVQTDSQNGGVMLKEFKDFLMKGNIVDLAVAFVLGVAFGALVNSLVNNLVMPIVAMIIGKPDFSNLTFTINDAVFRYGAFITDLITFVATAAAIFFFVVKPVGAVMARMAKPRRGGGHGRGAPPPGAARRAQGALSTSPGLRAPPRRAEPTPRGAPPARRSGRAGASAQPRSRAARPARTPRARSCRAGS